MSNKIKYPENFARAFAEAVGIPPQDLGLLPEENDELNAHMHHWHRTWAAEEKCCHCGDIKQSACGPYIKQFLKVEG